MAGLGIFPHYFARVPETLRLQDKIMSLSGGSAEIRLLDRPDGTPFLQVQGKTMSLKGRRTVIDVNTNTPIFDIVKEHMHIHTTYAAVDPSGTKLLEVKSHFSLTGTKADATFTDHQGQARTLRVQGDWLGREATIEDERATPVAHISKKTRANIGHSLMGSQTYMVEVMPGVDKALIVAMCICLDAKADAERGS